ncbi:MAG: hypothetical protein ACK4NC_07200 [Candidatus Gracilibacteria bacterium]
MQATLYTLRGDIMALNPRVLYEIIKRNQDYERRKTEYYKDIVPAVEVLTSTAVREFTKSDPKGHSLDEYIKMIEKDPFVRACVELKALRATMSFGKYVHPNPTIQEWVNNNLYNMENPFHTIIAELASAMPLGFAVGEILYYPRPDKTWGIKGIKVLDPRRVTFNGNIHQITHITYRLKSGKTVNIPYKKCIHVTAGYTTNFGDPYGSPECKRAYPYYKAKQTVLAELTIAIKNNATGIWVGYADPNTKVMLHNPDGTPIRNNDGSPATKPVMELLMRQLQDLENNSVVVTDTNTRIDSIRLGVDAGLWSFALNYFNEGIAQSFHMPLNYLGEAQAIVGGKMEQHGISALDTTIQAVTRRIKDEFLQKALKPILALNFNETELGDFEEVISNDPTARALYMQNIITAVSMQLIDGADPDVQNKIRELLNIPKLKETYVKGKQVQSRKPNSTDELLDTLYKDDSYGFNKDMFTNRCRGGRGGDIRKTIAHVLLIEFSHVNSNGQCVTFMMSYF